MVIPSQSLTLGQTFPLNPRQKDSKIAFYICFPIEETEIQRGEVALLGAHTASKWCFFFVLAAQSRPTLLQPHGSSVHGISQAEILEWVAIHFCRESSRLRDRTHVSCVGRWILYHRATREVLEVVGQGFIKPRCI